MTRITLGFWLLASLALACTWPWLDGLPEAATLRYWLGWGGFALMVLTNLYILRKRLPQLKDAGKPARWLDFHIFCGLMGPTLVVFHTDFKVDGIVAISFWSMIISVASGIVGRYFYTQLLKQRGTLRHELRATEAYLTQLTVKQPTLYPAAAMASGRSEATRLAFGGYAPNDPRLQLVGLWFASVVGDIRLRVQNPDRGGLLPYTVRPDLKRFGLIQRRIAHLDAYKRLMGYWHTFHVPFAVFMYVVALIHIAAELIFRVSA